MSLATFRYSRGLIGTFELPTEAARRLLHPSLEPVEVHHGTSVLAVSVFDFTESPFGPYGELFLAVLVAPFVRPGQVMPQAALYPYVVGTTNAMMRQMVLPQWPLPYWQEDMACDFSAGGGQRKVAIAAGGAPLLEMTLHELEWGEEAQVHQVFAIGQSGGSAALITTRGSYSDNEDGQGDLQLHPHPMLKGLDVSAVDGPPLREACLADGVRIIDSLVSL
jgi:hypothetical protein